GGQMRRARVSATASESERPSVSLDRYRSVDPFHEAGQNGPGPDLEGAIDALRCEPAHRFHPAHGRVDLAKEGVAELTGSRQRPGVDVHDDGNARVLHRGGLEERAHFF